MKAMIRATIAKDRKKPAA